MYTSIEEGTPPPIQTTELNLPTLDITPSLHDEHEGTVTIQETSIKVTTLRFFWERLYYSVRLPPYCPAIGALWSNIAWLGSFDRKTHLETLPAYMLIPPYQHTNPLVSLGEVKILYKTVGDNYSGILLYTSGNQIYSFLASPPIIGFDSMDRFVFDFQRGDLSRSHISIPGIALIGRHARIRPEALKIIYEYALKTGVSIADTIHPSLRLLIDL